MDGIEKPFGKDVVLAYGCWSRKCPMKHFMLRIGRGLRKILSKHFEPVSVNEFRTSKMCCNCEKEMEYMKLKGNSKKVYISHM